MDINIGDRVLLCTNKKTSSCDFILKEELVDKEGLIVGFYPVGAIYEVEVDSTSYLLKIDVMKKI